MAKDAAETIKPPFDHGSRFVTVLVPQSSTHENYVRNAFDEKYGPEAPPLVNVIKIAEVSPDTILYISHPIRVKRKTKDKAGRDVWKKTAELFVSRPIDVGAECTDSPRRGAKIVDYNKIAQTINRVIQNDPSNLSFSSFVSGFNRNDVSEATIQLISC